ncbi:MAG: adenylosuccinate lyase [Clostridiales Family XIII bacterium]|nr:adenylosuccinate lyase [Clostridiales Family XIII bacterium]
MSRDQFSNPLTTRYASREMSYIFSPQFKFSTWRRLWIALAESEMELGLPITQEQVNELKKYADDINFEAAEAREKEVRHDVMSHVYAYGLQAKSAAGIIHLGATSAFVGDNTDIIQMREGLILLRKKLALLMKNLSDFALEYKDLPTLGFTHYQPAQLTTVGKRAALWLQDFYLDYVDVCGMIETIQLRGVKGTTGTQASFVELFKEFPDGDERIRELERKVSAKVGVDNVIDLTGQTYTRKIDFSVLSILSGIAQSASKMATDIRLLQSMKEVEEPFEKNQIGSSAMAYKRNPMRSERVCSLSRVIIAQPAAAAGTAATQWFERTLDDSAAKRIIVPESFMATDAVLDILRNVTSGLVVYDSVITSHVMAELPFMTTENIIMEAVNRGGDRQKLHEQIREHSMAAAGAVKKEGKPNDLLGRIAGDPAFSLTENEIEGLLDPKLYTGRAAQQTEDFIREKIEPIIRDIVDSDKVELKV